MTWSDVKDLGKSCPDLQTLKINILSGSRPFERPLAEASTVSQEWQNMRLLTADKYEPMITLPALKVFLVGQLKTPHRDDFLTQAVIWLLSGTPMLEEFHLRSDAMDTCTPKPSIGQSFLNPPPSLRKLHLEAFRLTKESLRGISVDKMKSLEIRHCDMVDVL